MNLFERTSLPDEIWRCHIEFKAALHVCSLPPFLHPLYTIGKADLWILSFVLLPSCIWINLSGSLLRYSRTNILLLIDLVNFPISLILVKIWSLSHLFFFFSLHANHGMCRYAPQYDRHHKPSLTDREVKNNKKTSLRPSKLPRNHKNRHKTTAQY